MNTKDQFDYIAYGAKVNAEEVAAFLSHSLQMLKDRGRVTPLCIWGTHGIGKTELVRDFAKENNCAFVYIAPAQFEEMGDLIGLPDKDEANGTTRFLPPEWTPKTEGPGVLLIDDVNRADDRILRGIMQLLQHSELIIWTLPTKWMIVLTANPDGGDYSVTAMDDAMITRMAHVTMKFDVKTWARWAEKTAIDPRGISFVLNYPEIVNNQRTTPRSLVQFFESIRPIEDLKTNLSLVHLLAKSYLDEETAAAFTNFIHMDLDKLLSPEEILEAANFAAVQKRLEELVIKNPPRLDILSIMTTRLTNHVVYTPEKITDKKFDNLRRFILLPFIPNDLRLFMAQDLLKSERADLKRLYAIPEIGKLILRKM